MALLVSLLAVQHPGRGPRAAPGLHLRPPLQGDVMIPRSSPCSLGSVHSTSRSSTQCRGLCHVRRSGRPSGGCPGTQVALGPSSGRNLQPHVSGPLGPQGRQKVPVCVTSHQPRTLSASSSGPGGRAEGEAPSLPGAELISRPQVSVATRHNSRRVFLACPHLTDC